MSEKEEKYEKEKVSPFVWVDALTQRKGDPMAEHGEAEYPAFMVTRSMSQYQDCLLIANEINVIPSVSNRMQYDYYRNSIRPKKRFGKWGKKKDVGDVKMLMEHYDCNRARAEEALRILTKEQLDYVRELQK